MQSTGASPSTIDEVPPPPPLTSEASVPISSEGSSAPEINEPEAIISALPEPELAPEPVPTLPEPDLAPEPVPALPEPELAPEPVPTLPEPEVPEMSELEPPEISALPEAPRSETAPEIRAENDIQFELEDEPPIQISSPEEPETFDETFEDRLAALERKEDILEDVVEDESEVLRDEVAQNEEVEEFSIPWWVFLLFGILVVSIVVSIYLYFTRCPCEHEEAKQQDETPDDAKKVEPPGDLHTIQHVVGWHGSSMISPKIRIFFLNKQDPYPVFACDASTLFSIHRRIRIRLPRAPYMARVVFPDGTQHVCQEFSEDMELHVHDGHAACARRSNVPAFEVPTGACALQTTA